MAVRKVSGEIVAVANQASKERDYWTDQLSGELVLSSFPYDQIHSGKSESSFNSVEFTLTDETVSRLMKYSKGRSYTLHMILMAGLVALLERYTSNKDIIVGAPIYKQEAEGDFLNTILPVRTQLREGMTFKELLLLVRETIIEGTEYQNFPIQILAYQLNKAYAKEDFSLFDTALLLTNIHDPKYIEHAKPNTLFSFTKSEDSIQGALRYNSGVYDQSTIERLVNHYMRVLELALADVDTPLAQLEALTEGEVTQMIREFNQTEFDYGADRTLNQLFEEQVAKTPNQQAVIYKDQSVTYAELNQRANQLARLLREEGIEPNQLVGISASRSIEMIVGLLGILKAGGAYLPIDPTYPEDRIRYMVKDSNIKVLLVDGELALVESVKMINIHDEALQSQDDQNLEPVSTPSDLAYMIYTSGSTGHPKGVMIEHQSIMNTLSWRKHYYEFDEQDTALQLPSFSFDSSVEDIFTPLISGSSLVMVDEEQRLNLSYLKQVLKQNQVTHFLIVPNFYQMLLQEIPEALEELRIVTVAGDSFTEELVKEHFAKLADVRLCNEYGPTENSVCSTAYEFSPENTKIVIGKPIDNVTCYILDQEGRIAPIGTTGELVVGGKGLARGYYQRPELTSEKFAPNPVVAGEKIYKTGDLARWLADGNIEFLGRIDQQVKIRGFRVELGEIENRLLQQPKVNEATVLALENEHGEKALAAYVVAEGQMKIGDLKSQLGENLPEYMVPQYLLFLDEMPLLPNGKIDKKALSKLKMETEVEYVAPRNQLEEGLVAIWSEILELEESAIGIHHNFFDLGGHSLKVTGFVTKVSEKMQVELPISEVFESPTIAELAELIKGMDERIYASIEPVEKRDYYPLSSAQRRLFALGQVETIQTSYNTPATLIIEGDLDIDALEAAFQEVVKRHESLRTSFKVVGGDMVQQVEEDVEFKLDYIVSEQEDATVETLVANYIQPFNLAKPPLLRVGLIKLPVEEGALDKYLLIYDMHHIISDGVSMSILIKEMTRLYQGQKLEPLPIQYKDFTIWQNDLFESDKIKDQEEFWLGQFADEIPELNLPTDYTRPSVMTFEGDRITFSIDQELTDQLNDLAKENKATLYMVLLATYSLLLSKYSGQEDLVVGSAIAGRSHVDLENIIGMFVNTLAMRTFPESGKTFTEFLIDLRDRTLQVYKNQDFPFEMLLKKLDVKWDMSRNPLFNALFSLQNMQNPTMKIDDLNFTKYSLKNNMTKFDVTLIAMESDTGINFNLEYYIQIYKEETMQRFKGHFINLLKEVVTNPDRALSEIPLISTDEKLELINDLNNTGAEYNKDHTIHQTFEEQVALYPDQSAVVLDDESLTYAELNQKANRLAHLLREKGVARDEIVGVMVPRSIEMIVSVLAVMKAGGAYLPIDAGYPEERIEFMLTDSQTRFLLTDQTQAEIDFAGEIINPFVEASYTKHCQNPEQLNQPTDLAYIIYTSGSTGRPKGVMVEHRGVINLACYLKEELEITPQDRIIQFASLSFDASVWEMMMTLLSGASLYLISPETMNDYRKCEEFMNHNQITIATLPPAYANYLVPENIQGLRVLITAGSASTWELINKWKDRVHYVNGYGPTEATVCSTAWHYTDGDYKTVPIGKPIKNTRVYILDHNDQIAPMGVVGEICVAGPGLARGYLHQEELTQTKFIPNPVNPAERIYRTGDLGRRLPDGNVEFSGRKDYQVKIRGFRIEPGEIESLLSTHPDLIENIVIDLEDEQDEKCLVTYYSGVREMTAQELTEYLLEKLPEYMVPAHFIQMDQLPVTPNGKIDRKKLPSLQTILKSRQVEGATTKTEKRLQEVWSEILGVEDIGIDDKFFELGGHSLNSTTLAARVYKEFDVEMSLDQIFKTPTIKELAGFIDEQSDADGYTSIQPVEEREYYPLSSAQRRLLLLDQFDNIGTTYNIATTMMVEGPVDVERLERAFAKLIQRHESLRTSFEFIEGEPVQQIHPKVDFKINYQVLDSKTDLQELVREFVQPFDLRQAPLLNVGLVKLPDAPDSVEKHLFIFDMHHIISDGLSLKILIKDVADLYTGVELPELDIQYKDFAVWQNQLLESEEMKAQEEYWVDQFSGDLQVLNIPTDFPRQAVMNFKGDRVNFTIDQELTSKLKELTDEKEVTLYMLLLAAFNILLAKYSGQEDITVGSPIAGRHHADLENIIGMFVNTLAMRNYPKSDQTFEEFLADVKERAIQAYQNQDYQFEMLIDKVQLQRDRSNNPLFNVMFILQNIGLDNTEIFLDDLKFIGHEIENDTATFDLNLTAFETGQEIGCTLEYKTNLYKEETIQRLITYYLNILNEITVNPLIKLEDIEMLSEEEKALFNQTTTNLEPVQEWTINELFEEQVNRTPNRYAVTFNDQSIRYRELNQRANQMARELRAKGVQPEDIVGIYTGRSIEMIVGMMAILKAGAAYLPLDPTYPDDRIRYMIEDSQLKVLLFSNSVISQEILGQVTMIDIKDPEIYNHEGTNLPAVHSPKNLGYIIYTSGSTGNPKGVMIEHRTITNTLTWRKNYYQFNERDVVLQIPSFSFDSSVEDIFTPLLSGSKLVLINQEDRFNLNYLQEIIEKNRVTHFLIVPNFYRLMLKEIWESLQDLRVVTVAGDNFTEELVKEHFEKLEFVRLVNEYGPTENSVCTTVYEFYPDQPKVLIGKPIDNVSCYILDKSGRQVSIGAVGQLYISGRGLARGYFRREELTQQKFVANPFVPGERLYQTGDLARWTEDGNIEFLGRGDDQIKIRGFRVELGEIENQFLQHDAIREAVVLALDDQNQEKYLAAYLVAAEEGIDEAEVREYVSHQLPEYMVPQYCTFLNEMPLLPNGKIDKKSLPTPKVSLEVEYVAPRDEMEKRLVRIWAEILEMEEEAIGIDHNFFNLGGHSLKATAFVSKVFKKMNVELPIGQVFATPTVRRLAEFVQDEAVQSQYASIEAVEEREYYPVSSAQKRLFVIDQLRGQNTAYNIADALIIEGSLDGDRLEDAFQKLIQRHDSLRTGFEMADQVVIQKILPQVEFKIQELTVADGADLQSIVQEFVRPFDLSEAPLLRVGLGPLPLEEGQVERALLVFDMHHAISDGISMNILIREIGQLYHGGELPELRIQYKDFAVWQNELFESDKIKKQEEYWLQEFVGEIPVLNLPTDHPRPVVSSFAGDRVEREIGSELTAKLNELAKAKDATLYMVLLSAYNLLLSKYSGQEDIVIGTPIAGRSHPDLESIVGMFVNTLAMRNHLSKEQTFIQLLKDVTQRALQAFENQDYPFEMLVEQVDVGHDKSRNPLFDVMFVLQNLDQSDLVLDDLKFKHVSIESQVTKFDLTLTAVEKDEKLSFTLEYSSKLFERSTIERFLTHFTSILEQVTAEPEAKLAQIQVVSEAEKEVLLSEFNDTAVEYPTVGLVPQLFEEVAEKYADRVALALAEEELTYGELNQRANQLARTLRERGVGRNSIVTILLENSFERIIAVIGVLKAGGAYLPIDPTHPVDRINYIIDDCSGDLLLSTTNLVQHIDYAGEWIDVLDDQLWTGEVDNSNLEVINQPEDLAYVIYTSGSTGQPKGVMIEHQGFLNTISWRRDEYEFGPEDVSLQLFSYAFDGFVITFFTPIVSGSKVVLLKEGEAKNPFTIKDLIISHQVTYFMCVPSLYATILESFEGDEETSLRSICLGADKTPFSLVKKSNKVFPDIELINEYGPTENSVVTTHQRNLQVQDEVTIGKPVANNQVYVLDQDDNLVPIGVPGELCISGVGLARGYINQPELTEERFVQNPFDLEKRLYHTGDLVSWTEEGTIRFLGRIDNQVTVRGFRIELKEIENLLMKHELVKDAVVIDREDQNDQKYLCGYLVSDEELIVSDLRKHLINNLPDYMIPAHFVQLNELPLNSNGKLDRSALPEPDGSVKIAAEYLAPRNQVEEELAQIWSQVLGMNLEEIGVNYSFFDLGGNSLKLVKLTKEINSRFEMDINVVDLFNYTTIEQITTLIGVPEEEEVQKFTF